MEQHYVFIKDDRVVNIAVFESKNQSLADTIKNDQGYDSAIWVGESAPAKWSSYDGETFTDPTEDYLISIGVTTLSPVIEPIVEEELPNA